MLTWVGHQLDCNREPLALLDSQAARAWQPDQGILQCVQLRKSDDLKQQYTVSGFLQVA